MKNEPNLADKEVEKLFKKYAVLGKHPEVDDELHKNESNYVKYAELVVPHKIENKTKQYLKNNNISSYISHKNNMSYFAIPGLARQVSDHEVQQVEKLKDKVSAVYEGHTHEVHSSKKGNSSLMNEEQKKNGTRHSKGPTKEYEQFLKDFTNSLGKLKLEL